MMNKYEIGKYTIIIGYTNEIRDGSMFFMTPYKNRISSEKSCIVPEELVKYIEPLEVGESVETPKGRITFIECI